MPAKEKELLDITRRQKILEELYSFLLQKKLETSISSASTISNVKVIESALATNNPVRPKRSSAYIMAFFIGLAIPAVIIFLLEYLNDKIFGLQDVKKVTQAPIIGDIGHSEEKGSLVVSKTSRKFIAEQFRIIRTNLQYFLPKQEKSVILVTSSMSGEGKSFISTNMGAVMALAGKRTVILEFDIRKPKIMSGLNLPKKTGITNYVIGSASFDELPVPVPGVDNLFVIPCGPVPPNPAELLLDIRLDELISELKRRYEIIIVDTAPVGLVSDAVVLAKYADACLYVVRHNYTFKKQLQLLDEMYTQKKLPRMSIVVNDIKAGSKYGNYYGYGGNGYSGFGYGYGSEYFDESVPKTNSLFKFFIRNKG
jgi:capsular exopolysaccharide synthesis family protein